MIRVTDSHAATSYIRRLRTPAEVRYANAYARFLGGDQPEPAVTGSGVVVATAARIRLKLRAFVGAPTPQFPARGA